MRSIRIYGDFKYIIQSLNDDEIGRLFVSMMQYAAEVDLTKLEDECVLTVWPIVRAMLDQETNISLCRIEE